MSSTLDKKELAQLSMKQLLNFKTGVEGEDLALVEEVIKEKSGKKELGEMEPGVAAGDKKVSERKQKVAKTDEEKKAELAAKEELRKKRQEQLEEKRKQMTERLEKKNAEKESKKQETIAMMEKKAAAKEEREKARKEANEKKMLAQMEKKAEVSVNEEKVAQIKARMVANFEGEPSTNVDMIRRCMLLKLNNAEIKAVTGFSTKFICDTTWRLERNVTFFSMQKSFKEVDLESAKENTESATEEGTEENPNLGEN